ncbi:hypothetical protein M513_08709 [Trichuris suis]|uniref:Uncharacterized protein n=1 Tax=Trichuris suis TaxID=68888 RepID=A0A085LZT6_9BILA|nr:hypothetical protein M513_08709 [Trichuris suis]
MKPSILKEHLTRCHPDKRCKDVAYFCSLREKISSHRTLLSIMAPESNLYHGCLLTSYSIALMIAKSGKPHSVGEDLVLPATAEIL